MVIDIILNSAAGHAMKQACCLKKLNINNLRISNELNPFQLFLIEFSWCYNYIIHMGFIFELSYSCFICI